MGLGPVKVRLLQGSTICMGGVPIISLALAVVQQGHDDGSGSSAAYQVRAQAEAQLGELKKASEDLTAAEKFERDAITRMQPRNGELVKQHYVPVLKGLLRFHARVSSALGQGELAAAEQAEADRL